MLTHIDIKQFITITEAHIALNHGLTVITGDTGSGKSLFIAAIQFGLGHKMTLKGVETANTQVCLTFDISQLPVVQQWLEAQGLSDLEGQCIVSRNLTDKQRSRCFINQNPTTLGTLSQLGELLLDIHGQHDSYLLLKNEHQMQLLDPFCSNPQLPHEVSQSYQRWYDAIKALDAAKLAYQQQKDQQSLLQYQWEELDQLDVSPENIQALDQQQKLLANADMLGMACQQWQEKLTGDNQGAMLPASQSLLQEATQLTATMPSAIAIAAELNQAIIHLEEASGLIQAQMHQIAPDPQALAETDALLGQLLDLARKHHVDCSQLIDKKAHIAKTLKELDQNEANCDALTIAASESLKDYQHLAEELSKQRHLASSQLAKSIIAQMQQLNFLQAKVNIALIPSDDDTPKRHGLEQVHFEMSTNPGQGLQPLRAVASGGELSRISLAIQVATCEKHTLSTLIFDEIDVGIGGKTAEMVGKQLRALGTKTQVVCITHLPQVASQGHQHLCVEKEVVKGQTQTALNMLSPKARIEEIARMVGGIDITDKTLAHAEAMLAVD